jgi:hypothetical protein
MAMAKTKSKGNYKKLSISIIRLDVVVIVVAILSN